MTNPTPSVEERMAVFEQQITTIHNSLHDLTLLIHSLLPTGDDTILPTSDAPTYAPIAAVESEITLDKAELALTRNPSSSTTCPLARVSPPCYCRATHHG